MDSLEKIKLEKQSEKLEKNPVFLIKLLKTEKDRCQKLLNFFLDYNEGSVLNREIRELRRIIERLEDDILILNNSFNKIRRDRIAKAKKNLRAYSMYFYSVKEISQLLKIPEIEVTALIRRSLEKLKRPPNINKFKKIYDLEMSNGNKENNENNETKETGKVH